MPFPGHFDPNENLAPRLSSHNSSLRRPWSPIRYDADITDNGGTYEYFVQDQISVSMQRGKRQARNTSENSVEALDLADYAKTLCGPTTERNDPYLLFTHTSHHHPFAVPTPVHATQLRPFREYHEYPPSPANNRPFSAQSRHTFNQTPPSLISGETSHDTHESYGSHYPYSTRRPHYLPPFISPVSAEHHPTRGPEAFATSLKSPRQSAIHIAPLVSEERDEADISRFPAFSRGWYDEPHKAGLRKHSSLPPYSSEFQYDHTGSYTNQARNILPWGSQLADSSGPQLDCAVKEERIRMLEHEFGKKGRPEDTGEPTVGSVDKKGALITIGLKKRVIARWAQGILALATAVSSLYGALVGIVSIFLDHYLTSCTVH